MEVRPRSDQRRGAAGHCRPKGGAAGDVALPGDQSMKNFRAACSYFAAIVFVSLLPRGAPADPMMQIATVETTDTAGYAQFVKELTGLHRPGAPSGIVTWYSLKARSGPG